MNSNLLSFVLSRLDRRSPNWSEVARASGVPYSTLKKIASRVTPNPGVQHVQALADYFAQQEPQAHLLSEVNGPKSVVIQEGRGVS